MGREIRRVPPNWKHPREDVLGYSKAGWGFTEKYIPMRNASVEDAWEEWREYWQEWLDGGHDEVIKKYGASDYPKNEPYRSFCEWHGLPPDPKSYRPSWTEHEATWYQVYETVSEGTPVSPPFATQAALVDYLVENGDFSDQQRREEGAHDMDCRPWSREDAERFVYETQWAMSLIGDKNGLRSGFRSATKTDPFQQQSDNP